MHKVDYLATLWGSNYSIVFNVVAKYFFGFFFVTMITQESLHLDELLHQCVPPHSQEPYCISRSEVISKGHMISDFQILYYFDIGSCRG